MSFEEERKLIIDFLNRRAAIEKNRSEMSYGKHSAEARGAASSLKSVANAIEKC